MFQKTTWFKKMLKGGTLNLNPKGSTGFHGYKWQWTKKFYFNQQSTMNSLF